MLSQICFDVGQTRRAADAADVLGGQGAAGVGEAQHVQCVQVREQAVNQARR